MESETIEIPIRNSEEVIELECSNLPEPDEVLQILVQEKGAWTTHQTTLVLKRKKRPPKPP